MLPVDVVWGGLSLGSRIRSQEQPRSTPQEQILWETQPQRQQIPCKCSFWPLPGSLGLFLSFKEQGRGLHPPLVCRVGCCSQTLPSSWEDAVSSLCWKIGDG